MKTEISQKLILLNSYLGYGNNHYNYSEKVVYYVENDKYKRDYNTTKKLVPDYNFLVLVLLKLDSKGYNVNIDFVNSTATVTIKGETEPIYRAQAIPHSNYNLLERNICIISECVSWCQQNS